LRKINAIVKAICAAILVAVGYVSVKADSPESVVAKMRSGLADLSGIENAALAYKCRYKLVSKGEPLSESSFTVKRSGKSLLVVMGNSLMLLTEEVLVCLEKKPGSSDWALARFSRSNPSEMFKKNIGNLGPVVYPMTSTFAEENVSVFFDNSKSSVMSSLARDDGAIELAFSRKEMISEGETEPPSEGTMLVSPKNFFAITRIQQTTAVVDPKTGPYAFQSVLVRKITGEADSTQCQKIERFAINGSTGEEISRETFEFQPMPGTALDPAEFTVAYYNVPVPKAAPEDNPTPWWGRWYIPTGFLLLIGAIILRRMVR